MTDPVKDANVIQHRAARPDVSVALRASAGSGKTKVLVDRFLRLCIEGSGRAHPRAILAITFTRRAAVEIQERLLTRAREMALANDRELTGMLGALFAGRPDPAPSQAEKDAAATLLEKILEDVSGLNVGTIHSFCQLILGRFAAEAGLDPHFSVLEDPDDLIDEALEQLEHEMASDPELQAAATQVGPRPTTVRAALRGVLSEQMRLGRWLAAHGSATGARLAKLPLLMADLRGFLFPDLSSGSEPEAMDFRPLLAAELEDFAGPGVDAIAGALGAELDVVKPKNLWQLRDKANEAAAALRDAPDAAAFFAQVTATRRIFLTARNRTRAFTTIRKDPELKERFNALVSEQALGVLGILHRLGYIELYQYNRDLLRLALRLLDIYDGLKKRDRVIDFQDLEDMACRLMGDQGSVGSLLYRLDDSLSHILVDEFQDTNYNQRDMLWPFVEEFLAGDQDGRQRTLFFVGDVKQSIYGFRGAEPDIFADVCRDLRDRGLREENLPTNFRSLEHIVGGVGCLFNTSPLADALPPAERTHVRQAWARSEDKGRIHVLAPFKPGGPDDGADADGRSGDQLAAQAAARWVRQTREDPDAVTWDGFGDDLKPRSLRWDDFLVLTRSRTEISLYEKAFRDAGIPFVPPGRGMLAASREVQDILALLRWLLWPEDDIALATVLRSPLFRLAEDDFQQLLAERGLLRPGGKDGRYRMPDNLWRALRRLGARDPFTRPARLLAAWRKHLGFDTCHDLLRRVYREGDVLERYQVARGDQARYNLLRLYDLALSPEIAGTPTVRRLVDLVAVAASRGGQDEGALPHTADEGRVRFMTVHGAKGLEAPIVLLVDADRPTGRESLHVRVQPGSADTPLLFRVTSVYRDGFTLPASVNWPLDQLQGMSEIARQRDRTEEANLLYVALTRARDSLVVLGGDREKGDDFDSPLRRIRRAAIDGGCGEHFLIADPAGLTRPQEQLLGVAANRPAAAADQTTVWQPPLSRETMSVITPSGVANGDDDEIAMSPTGVQRQEDELEPAERGHQVHLLLQLAADYGSLPTGDWACRDEAAAVFNSAELAWVFRPETVGGQGLSEVPIIHRRSAATAGTVEERVTGVIDRLVVRPGRVDIIDYKTNRFGGEAARRASLVAHYRPQLTSYREAVARLYPDRALHTWLLFTEPGLPDKQRLEEVSGI